MKSFKAKFAAACASAIVVLHVAAAFDRTNIVAQVADKAVEVIEKVLRFLLAA